MTTLFSFLGYQDYCKECGGKSLCPHGRIKSPPPPAYILERIDDVKMPSMLLMLNAFDV